MFEPREVAGLGDVREDSDLQHLDCFLGLLRSCHDDDREGRVDHANLLEQLEAVELFQLGIEHDKIGAPPVYGGNCFAAVLGSEHLVGATVLEQPEKPRQGSTLGPFGKNENALTTHLRPFPRTLDRYCHFCKECLDWFTECLILLTSS